MKLQLEAQAAGITLIHHDEILKDKETSGEATREVVNGGNKEGFIEPSEESKTTVAFTTTIAPISSHSNVNSTDVEEYDQLFGGVNDGKEVNSPSVKKGTEVKLLNLYLSEIIGTMRMRKSLLTVECLRCKTRNDFTLNSQQ